GNTEDAARGIAIGFEGPGILPFTKADQVISSPACTGQTPVCVSTDCLTEHRSGALIPLILHQIRVDVEFGGGNREDAAHRITVGFEGPGVLLLAKSH